MRLGVSNARQKNNDGRQRRWRWRGIYDIYVVYMLCGDTAYLHKKVLSEVVLGEFHAAIRAPSQPGKWETEAEAEAEIRG